VRRPLKVSLVIRCFNEEAHIGRLLAGVRRQRRRPDQVIVVDSGSTDATLAIASSFDVDVVRIRPDEFSFGRALNVGFRAATGDAVVVASAHVYPVYDTWIEHLVDALEDRTIALSYGRQVVPPHGAYSERRVLERWFPETSVARQRDPFCNNANACVRRAVWEEQPYDETLTGLEDLDWAKRAIERGLLLAYRADAPVVHVHDEGFWQIVNRYRREAIAHKQIYREQRMPLPTAVGLGLANAAGDWSRARAEGVLRAHARDVLRFRVAQFWGTYRGFAQEGPVPTMLRRRFYYPPELAAPAPEERAPAGAVGTPIDYDELLA